MVKWPAFELNPVTCQSEKRQSKTYRPRPSQAEKPLVRDKTPQGSRDCQCEETKGHCHHCNRKCEKTKAERTPPEQRHRSVGAQREAIEQQKPGFSLRGLPDAGCDGASTCRQSQPIQEHHRAIPVENKAVRAAVVDEQVDDGNDRIKNRAQRY